MTVEIARAGRTARTPTRGRRACAPLFLLAASLLAPAAASAAEPPAPPPPTATNGNAVSVVARGIPSPAQIAVGHGRVFVSSAGDEETNMGGGVYQVWRGKATQIHSAPSIGVVYRSGTLYASSANTVIAWSDWRNGAFMTKKVIFRRPIAQLPFLGTMAMGPTGRLFVGSTDAGEKGPIDTPLSGRVFSMRRDGSDLRELAKGLRQPFGIAFRAGDGYPYVANEADESTPTPPDLLVRAAPGSDFGFRSGCQWLDATSKSCTGKTAPLLKFPAHASPTGMVGSGTTIYVAFFGGTTKAGPEVRALAADGSSKQVVRSALPLIGVGLSGRWLFFSDVSGSVYRVKT